MPSYKFQVCVFASLDVGSYRDSLHCSPNMNGVGLQSALVKLRWSSSRDDHIWGFAPVNRTATVFRKLCQLKDLLMSLVWYELYATESRSYTILNCVLTELLLYICTIKKFMLPIVILETRIDRSIGKLNFCITNW